MLTSSRGVFSVAVMMISLTAATTAGAGSPSWHDANDTWDASNDPAQPTRLPALGVYAGFLLPSSRAPDGSWVEGDADWYAIDAAASTPTCTQLDVTSVPAANAFLAAGGERVGARLGHNESARLGLARPSRGDVTIGLVNPTGDWREYGAYTFGASSHVPSAVGGDGATGTDASAMTSAAVPIAPGCTSGSIQGITDVRDVYSFAATAGDSIVVSFADGSTGRLSLLNPDGTTQATLASGDILRFSAPATQTYYLSASSTGSTSAVPYLIGLVRDAGPEPEPCAPHC